MGGAGRPSGCDAPIRERNALADSIGRVTVEPARNADDGVHLVAVSGELDLASVPRLHASLEAPAARQSAAVVLDVSNVTFIDSTALAALLRANDELMSHGVRMVVVCPPGPVRRLLDMTSLADRLTLATDRAGALERARSSNDDRGSRTA
jgi:anti-sigma B factor antagonist